MKAVPLSDVCDISMGQAPKGTSYNTNGIGYPLLAGAGDFGDLTPIPSKFTVQPTKLSQPSDILLCIRASIGDLNWSDREYCLGRGVAGLRPKGDSLDRNYLWRWLSFARNDLENRARGSTFKQVSKKDIAEFEISLPESLDEQRRIAAILDKADAIRRKRECALTLADDLLKSTFLEMFGDPESNPKNWKRRTFAEIAEIDTNMVDPKCEPYIDLIHIGPDVIEGETGAILPARTARDDNLKSGKYIFGDEHILFTKIRPYLRKVALPDFEGVCSADIYPIKARPQISTKEFLWAVLISPAYVAYFDRLPDRANIPKINMKEMNAYECIYPPVEMQQQFSQAMAKILKSQNRMRRGFREASDLFNALSQRAFRGEL